MKDTHKEKTPSNKAPVLTKSMDMNIWVVGTSIHQINSLEQVLKQKQNFKKKHLLAKLCSL